MKAERQFVLAAGNPVEVQCEAGDRLVSGDCVAEEKLPMIEPTRDVMVLPASIQPKSIQIESKASSNGWVCQTSHQDVRQTLLVTARAKCSGKPK